MVSKNLSVKWQHSGSLKACQQGEDSSACGRALLVTNLLKSLFKLVCARNYTVLKVVSSKAVSATETGK